ncbi:hypothetical protein C5C29_04570 [Rathayibacter sp. AY1H2]|nr:hypothetical protein C5C29_04570 [Rathayibacter sp. AY1H2]
MGPCGAPAQSRDALPERRPDATALDGGSARAEVPRCRGAEVPRCRIVVAERRQGARRRHGPGVGTASGDGAAPVTVRASATVARRCGRVNPSEGADPSGSGAAVGR